VYVSDHTVPVGCNETTGEPDGVVQLETSDPGDEDLDSGLLVRFLVGHVVMTQSPAVVLLPSE
jgi:hypothetical protein